MVIVGLGSNVGDRAGYLRRAAHALGPLIADMRFSAVYENSAILPEGAPKEWDMPYLNMAALGRTVLEPLTLLVEIKRIEAALGRQHRGVWGPREIDIDILAYDDQVLNSDTLTLPHKALLDRDCAIVPLADIAPHWIYPAGVHKGMSARKLAAGRTASLIKTDIVVA